MRIFQVLDCLLVVSQCSLRLSSSIVRLAAVRIQAYGLRALNFGKLIVTQLQFHCCHIDVVNHGEGIQFLQIRVVCTAFQRCPVEVLAQQIVVTIRLAVLGTCFVITSKLEKVIARLSQASEQGN